MERKKKMNRYIRENFYDYNKTIHSAMKRRAFELFMRTAGYNKTLIDYD